MKISIAGTGYVGLVTGACFAEWGHTVACIDTNAGKIAMLNEGRMPIYEPGLERLVNANVEAGRLSFHDGYGDAVAGADAVFITVDTPPRSDMTPDLSPVLGALDSIAEHLRTFTVIVVKSTVPVGTCEELRRVLERKAPAADFSVASNPEFLREGRAVGDFLRPARVVTGTGDEKSLAVMREIYRPLIDGGVTFFHTDPGTAEMIKYASNAFLSVKLGFINEIADLCEALDLDVADVSAGIGLDPRIGDRFLQAGPGYGGSCFPKDTQGLLSLANSLGVPLEVLRQTIKSNESRKKGLAGKVAAVLQGRLSGRVIAVLGLAFKAATDDLRCSPSLDLIPALCAGGARVCIYDPQAMGQAPRFFPAAVCCEDAYTAVDGADLAVIHTAWEEFSQLDWRKVKAAMKHPRIYDFRNALHRDEMRALGFEYFSIGRKQGS